MRSTLLGSLERAAAAPATPNDTELLLRRSSITEGLAGRGQVVAKVDGCGVLVDVRIGLEMQRDLPQLERLVRKAVNRAVDGAERQAPASLRRGPQALDPMDYVPTWGAAPTDLDDSATPEQLKESRAAIEFHRRLASRQLAALLDAVEPIHLRINYDAVQLPLELRGLLVQVVRRLGDPRLNAASARRGAGFRDPAVLRRFRQACGISLTHYILDRQWETAARLAYTSDLPLEDIASMLGFASQIALLRGLESWGDWKLSEMREAWSELKTDYVILRWVMNGEAAPDHVRQVYDHFCRVNPKLGSMLTDPSSGGWNVDQ